MEIRSISKNLFGVKQNKSENNCNHTNPFGVNFKGNVIRMDAIVAKADVFVESGVKSNRIQELGKKGKLYASAMAGSIGKLAIDLSTRVKNIKANISNAWERANNIDVGQKLRECGTSLKGRVVSMNTYSVNNLRKQDPVNQIESVFSEVVAIKERA